VAALADYVECRMRFPVRAVDVVGQVLDETAGGTRHFLASSGWRVNNLFFSSGVR
jgi:hypothetical protein